MLQTRKTVASYPEYLEAALRHAEIERMENGKYFASIPQFDGLWAIGKTRDEAKKDLRSALDGWIDVQIKHGGDSVPIVDGVDLRTVPKAH